ncbi:MAG TPA: hypothetical protein VE174_06925 [Actinomycetota bacterium]|nr:hypothetical protein [Actinomycetota bacterium]
MKLKLRALVVIALALALLGPRVTGAAATAQEEQILPATILYAAAGQTGYPEIHLMRENGDHFARLTYYKGEDLSPVWSPDGERVAFIRDSDPRPPKVAGDILQDLRANYDLYLMAADGSNVVRLTQEQTAEDSPQWSPDGSSIAYISGHGENSDNFDVFVMDLDSGESRNITDDPADDYDPSWSPDGSTLAFYSRYRPCDEPCDPSQTDIYTIPAAGGEPTLLTGPEFDDIDPTWSPDGTRIFFSRAACCQFDLWSMEADGSDAVRLTRTRKADEGNISWSTGTDRFVFERATGHRSSIWMMDLGSGTGTRLTPKRQFAFTADWR